MALTIQERLKDLRVECGLTVEKFNDIKLGDIIEGYTMEEIPR